LALVVVAGASVAPVAAAASKAGSDPLHTAAMSSYIASRGGEITAAVEDVWTGRIAVLHPGVTEQTASIVKLDILETLLHRGMLDPQEDPVAEGMIERSDNSDATRLWNAAGASGGVSAFDSLAGLTETAPNPYGYWGLTTTTAADQLALLRQLALPGRLLGPAERAYALNLMEHVESDQRWGVSGGVPASASVALKNGWLPVSGGWQVNSVGRIKGGEAWYLLAVLTRRDPSEAYGIATIEGIAARVWRALSTPGESRFGRVRSRAVKRSR
jgi:hypothetical protein